MGEIWKPVVGYEDLYAVSDQGNVKRTKKYLNSSDNPLKPSVVSGYLRVTLSRNNRRLPHLVHRLVAAAFLGLPKGLVVNHKDGDRHNNNLKNLEVVTRSENERHKWDVLKNGSLNNVKLTRSQVEEIRTLYMLPEHSLRTLADQFGVSKSNISAIINGKTWV